MSDAENADDNCVEAFETLADCASDMNLDCEDFVDDCEDELEDFTDDCDDDFEDTAAEIIIPVK